MVSYEFSETLLLMMRRRIESKSHVGQTAASLGMTILVGSSFGPRAHREANFVLARVRLRVNHESQITLPEGRQRKLDPHATAVVADAGVASRLCSTLDRGFHLSAGLRLPIRSPHNFDVEQDIPSGQPGRGIEELHLNSAGANCELQRRGDFRVKHTGAQILDDPSVLLVDPLAQPIRAEFGRSCEFLIV